MLTPGWHPELHRFIRDPQPILPDQLYLATICRSKVGKSNAWCPTLLMRTPRYDHTKPPLWNNRPYTIIGEVVPTRKSGRLGQYQTTVWLGPTYCEAYFNTQVAAVHFLLLVGKHIFQEEKPNP